MKRVCVLGDGQLGRMLRQAAEPLGIDVWLTSATHEAPPLPWQPDVITAEIERWADTPLNQRLEQHPAFINRTLFSVIADRLQQKQLLDSLNLPCAHWQQPEIDQWDTLFNRLGSHLVIKRRCGGYDGRGQWRISRENTDTLPPDSYANCIAEQLIPFTGEVSLIGARNSQGECQFYPLTHNLHQDGILRASVVLPQPDTRQQQAQTMLTTIMQHLNYVGVMAMECFITHQGLLINELAPRVHNSGHWTQNGASISQFSLHLCSLLNLPVAPIQIHQPSIMINLIGCELDYRWLSVPNLFLHWYHKAVHAGRKVGHLNLSAPTSTALCQALKQLRPLLPTDYASCIQWASQKF